MNPALIFFVAAFVALFAGLFTSFRPTAFILLCVLLVVAALTGCGQHPNFSTP